METVRHKKTRPGPSNHYSESRFNPQSNMFRQKAQILKTLNIFGTNRAAQGTFFVHGRVEVVIAKASI